MDIGVRLRARRRTKQAVIIVQICLVAVMVSGGAQWWQTGQMPWFHGSIVLLGIGILLWGDGLRRRILRTLRRG